MLVFNSRNSHSQVPSGVGNSTLNSYLEYPKNLLRCIFGCLGDFCRVRAVGAAGATNLAARVTGHRGEVGEGRVEMEGPVGTGGCGLLVIALG